MTGAGIHGWGAALCRRRLSNEETQAAWNRPATPGSRAIAGHDEDAITLGVQAAFEALEGVDPSIIDGLIFAATTAPFAEKSSAALVADILALRPGARILDLNSSLRSGSNALSLACDWIAAGVCTRVLVVAADVRLQKPGAPDEILFGHAGVAVIVGSDDECTAEIVSRSVFNSSQRDSWRLEHTRFPLYADQRFSREGAYQRSVQTVLKGVLDATCWKPADVNKVVLYSPDIKSGSAALRQSGFDVKTQYCDFASPFLGLTGAPHTLLMLCAAMERSSAGERLVAIGYGDGADGIAVRMKETPARTPFRSTVRKSYGIAYNSYLSLHQLHAGSETSSEGFISEIMSERNLGLWLNLKTKKCATCGTVVTLPLPSCPNCRDDSHFEPFTLARRGTVFAITHEHYFPTPEPSLGMAVVDLDGGGRLTLQVADEHVPVEIGDRVELVLRRLHDAGGYPNYFWKCRTMEVSVE